ncbi:MAG: PLDc N-terminal domain-containing protein [Candidatus Aenigmarchaeota archaeon]|nr:PLDc N-terminal domain-containing protein [Candidatus Aenigmarchaeota archaeon]
MTDPYNPLYSFLFLSSFFIVTIIILIGSLILWIWMFIDLLRRKKFEDKTVWVLVFLFLGVFGAILYYFMVYRKLGKATN